MSEEDGRLVPKWYTVAEVAVLLGYGERRSACSSPRAT